MKKFEIRQPLPQNKKYEIVARETEVQKGKYSFQIESQDGALLVDNKKDMIATEYTLLEIVKVYENEVKSNSVQFYK